MSTTSTVTLIAPAPELSIATTSDQALVVLQAPIPTLEVSTLVGHVATVELDNAPEPNDLQISAQTGGAATVGLVAPKPSLLLQTGTTIQLVGSSSLEITAITGGVAAVRLTAPKPALGIDSEGDLVGSVSLQPDVPTLSITAASGSVATVEVAAALPTLHITGFRVGESTMQLTAPVPALEVTGLFGSSSTVVLLAPEPELLVWPDLAAALAGIFNAYCMNTENTKVSTYSNFPFAALVAHAGRYFGIASDGIYLLEGNDDAGANINAELKFGFDDFGSDQNKRVPHVYVGCEADGDLQFTVSVDESAEYAVSFSPRQAGIHTTRVKPGRGHRGRYWQPGLLNVEGCDFTVASLSLIEELLQNRIR